MSNKTFFSFKAFLKECNQKDVTKRVSIYLASSWILLQVLAITWEPLGLPKHSVVFLILALLVGFPLFMLIIWKYFMGSFLSSRRIREVNSIRVPILP